VRAIGEGVAATTRDRGERAHGTSVEVSLIGLTLGSTLLPQTTHHLEPPIMFNWAIIFFIIALLAAVFGFGGIAGAAAGAAKITFIVALVLAVASFISSRGRSA
jgi:uncharacterized membrane protein YtjA (UPF0391 family)